MNYFRKHSEETIFVELTFLLSQEFWTASLYFWRKRDSFVLVSEHFKEINL